MGRAFHHFSSCDSTQVETIRLAVSGAPEGTVVVADFQSAGRGRLGRSWWGEHGSSLLVSLLLRPAIPVARLPHFPLLAAVAGREALKNVTNLPIFIKWPNDLLLHQKKVAGILAEAGSADGRILHVVIGIGINVGQQSFPPGLGERATSLALAGGVLFSREAILEALLRSFDQWYRIYLEAGFSPVREAWRQGAATLGGPVTIPSQGVEGRAVDLDDEGALIVRGRDGQLQRIISGEIE